MYSRPPHQDIPRDLYGLPAAPPETPTPTPAPDRQAAGTSPAGVVLPRSRGVRPVIFVVSVIIGLTLLAGFAAAILLCGI